MLSETLETDSYENGTILIENYVMQLNLASPSQLVVLFHNLLGYPVVEKTPKGEPSVGEKALRELAKSYSLPAILLKYREVTKLLTTYTLENKETKLAKGIRGTRLLGEFNQSGTVTGRFSSSNPNLQNIPSHDAFGIRRMFIAKPGYRLVVADYSQIEPRLLAHISKDARLQKVFKEGRDLYSELSQELGITRDVAKTFFLAMNYGAWPKKVAYITGKTEREADVLIQKFNKLYPGIGSLRQQTKTELEAREYVQSIFGRKRRFPGYNNERDERKREAMVREAFNFRMQGASADIIKQALCRVRDCRPVATVHDEILFEIPDSQVGYSIEFIKEQMEDFKLDVPLNVEIKMVNNWGEK